MKTRAAVVLCGLLALAAAGASAQSAGAAGLGFRPRFTRLLKQDLSSVASYLMPTQQPARCSSGACCQADSYASPYGLTYVNSTQQQFGGRTYTTFYYTFHSNHVCATDLDAAQCCNASADNIWVDVDPTLRVKYVSFDGQRLSNSEQSEFGLKLGSVNLRVEQAAAGIPLAVTVEGAADNLCPPPGLAPLPGLCELVVQGATPANPNACCPATITVPNLVTGFVPPPGSAFQCSASLDASPFQLVFDGATSAGTDPADGSSRLVSYNFRLAATASCRANGVHDCCSAQLSYLDLKVTNGLPIASVTLNGRAVSFSTSGFNEPNTASYRSLVVDNLNLVADDLGAVGLPLAVVVRVAAGASEAADLCDPNPPPGRSPAGGCAYYLHSEDGLCCPSGTAGLTDLPAPPPGTCNPKTAVPAAEASVSLSYYERSCSPAATAFRFLLANRNSGAGSCGRPYCVDVCSWSLYLDPSVASQVAVGHELAVNNGKQVITPGNVATGTPASVTFTYGPAGVSTSSFYVSLPAGGATLSALCARNALPGQGAKACAAIVRSGDVYTTVFFDEADVMVPVAPGSSCAGGAALPPPPAAPTCTSPKPMATACLGVRAARFNTLFTSSVFDFALAPAADAATCVPVSAAGRPATVRVLLTPSAVDQLVTRNQVRPTAGLSLDRNSGVAWALPSASTTPATSLSFAVQGPLGVSDVCRQGVSPDQPAGSCAAEISGDAGCFRGFVAPNADGRLVWVSEQTSSSRGVNPAVVVPAVVVPVVVLLLALLVLAAWYRRRQQKYYRNAQGMQNGSVGSFSAHSDDLSRPLAGSLRDDLSLPSASPSDVLIRVPGASQGGAGPAAGSGTGWRR
ncbi:hypothetical protein CHLRE_10g420200v5 [Chlamydomonas reinhardtii]|uniref:Pherophorin domain-containing protein n=1 Tax=Chlamydomonas reinhardtii TaxID=3055 RepID=A0A2K3D939_CHLRE|nr:uncharacterized protein CHLRE_10g420200v5 [Chlamydomonas reinhardtii]XP_042919850.1 uncharacterized protein CHLRE_10g420200v5 [Chlamydomonas reinhardtii]PNW77049.1 hypothetical protein CHLRE_10g420200v5 [Chlamydomonas reinhardtii]PNW77050.1 hypothetical protein CHLRE_10g420200v5 [Chlamydomonas reinhardtii]